MLHYEHDDNPYDDLGGRIPSEMSEGSLRAIVGSGLGSQEMRDEVERLDNKKLDQKQRKINKLGAEMVRKAGMVEVTKPEESQGIDVQPIHDSWAAWAKKQQENEEAGNSGSEN